MKTVLKLSALLLLTFVFFACKQATGDSPGGSDTSKPSTGNGGGATPTIIPDSDLVDNDIAPDSLEYTVEGTWSIADAVFTGADAKISVKEIPPTYAEIANQIKEAITLPANTSLTLTYKAGETGIADVAKAGVVLVATFEANDGYIFEGNTDTKAVEITFDIVVVLSEPIVITQADIKDSDIAPTITGGTPTGTWEIGNGYFFGSTDAKITFSVDPTVSYTDIANAIRDAINITGVEISATYFNEPSGKISTSGHNLKATLTPTAGYIFDGSSQSKDIYILFDIEVQEIIPDAKHYADPNDEDPRTLQEIIDDKKTLDGDTIAVTGTFRENITVNKTLTFIGYGKDGGIIDGNASATVILVDGTAADLTIREGITITGGYKSKDYGAAVDVYQGKLTLDGGTITGNTNTADEGSIRVAGGGTFEMLSGSIVNNTGVGVFVSWGSSFSMSGGTIAENIDGGVFILSENKDFGSFSMTGGTITRNRAENYGAGLWVSGGTGVTISGGSITGNINTSAATGGDDLAALGTEITTKVTLSGTAEIGKTYKVEDGMIADNR